jgi:hypothetical protein
LKLKIEKNIPLSPKPHPKLGQKNPHASRNKYIFYPWKEMEIGDSFVRKCETKKEWDFSRRSILISGNNWAKRNNLKRKFKCRTENLIDVRIWRVE